MTTQSPLGEPPPYPYSALSAGVFQYLSINPLNFNTTNHISLTGGFVSGSTEPTTYSVIYNGDRGEFAVLVSPSYEQSPLNYDTILHASSNYDAARKLVAVLNLAIAPKYRELFTLEINGFFLATLESALEAQ